MPGTKQLFRVLAGALLVVAMLVQDRFPLTRGAGGLWAQDDETAAEVFHDHISGPIVQSKCVNCHVAGGLSGNTRLVFVRSSDAVDHTARNLRTFENLLDDLADEGGGSYVLNKIQGVAHGGGVQVPPGSADFANMERFLGLLGEEITFAALMPETLFDTVVLASPRKTLRRAALIFAGRIPTDAEYAAVEGGDEWALRTTIRGLMEGPQFHEFLIRASNDRLLTDRRDDTLLADGFVDFINENYRLRAAAYASGDERDWSQWRSSLRYGIRRAPLELIAHVVENDLPYTEILTADYVMANPQTAAAYGASTQFDDPQDAHEFKPSSIVSYYRPGYGGFELEDNPVINAVRIIDPGPLITNYPHAGILNTLAFLRRYPTTATNRNRARARWTYYHFLGLDVEKSASRTTDPGALADTNNPTMRNPNCTVCHSRLDPVAGAFQNYDEEGDYKSNWGGVDSLDRFYKDDPEQGAGFEITARSFAERQTVSITAWLQAGRNSIRTRPFFDPPRSEGNAWHTWWEPVIDHVMVYDVEGDVVTHVEPERLAEELEMCGGIRDYPHDAGEFFKSDFCRNTFPFEVPASGYYDIEVPVWIYNENDVDGRRRMLSVVANAYEDGDTWYRDMRAPGFAGEEAPHPDNSLQWLAQQIVADDRFAEATVKFWWPSIMGSEVAEPPEEAADADFKGQLLAFNAQDAEVVRLANGFRDGFHGGLAYNLKDLLVEIVLSKWFRSDAVTDANPVRRVALHNAGARRLLTPEELAHKTAAITGVQWGRYIHRGLNDSRDGRWSSDLTESYRLLYGGIDSDGITERARDITSVMVGVAKRHAARVSCPVVMREIYLLPDAERRLFAGIDPSVTAADAIKRKLVELHDKLLGVQVPPDSPDVEAVYQLFVDTWQYERESLQDRGPDHWFDRWDCSWGWGQDHLFFEGILDDVVVQYEDEQDQWYDFDWDRVRDFLDGMDFSDPHRTTHAWVVVLATLMMDYRYLYL